MGGYSSGGWWWRSKRGSTSGVISLDVRWIARKGYLKPGMYWLSWSRGDTTTGRITLIVDPAHPDAVILDYKTQRGNEPWRDVREVVPLVYTACTYGGERPWFLCKGCRTRRAVLYSPAGLFRCRECCDLAYESTRESEGDRARRKAERLKRRLGDDGRERFWVPPDKPKGMHWRTYSRLVDEIAACEDAVDRELDLGLMRILARWDRRAGAGDDDAADAAPEPGPRGEVFESFCDATIDAEPSSVL